MSHLHLAPFLGPEMDLVHPRTQSPLHVYAGFWLSLAQGELSSSGESLLSIFSLLESSQPLDADPLQVTAVSRINEDRGIWFFHCHYLKFINTDLWVSFKDYYKEVFFFFYYKQHES